MNNEIEAQAAERIYALAMKFFLANPGVMMGPGRLHIKRGVGIDKTPCCCGAGAAVLEATKQDGEYDWSSVDDRASLSSHGRLAICPTAWCGDRDFYNAFDIYVKEIKRGSGREATDDLDDSVMKRTAFVSLTICSLSVSKSTIGRSRSDRQTRTATRQRDRVSPRGDRQVEKRSRTAQTRRLHDRGVSKPLS